MSYGNCVKTEHTGAKNGGGYYGKRIDAKLYSRRRRRQHDKRMVRER
jgi:hypothetical protein